MGSSQSLPGNTISYKIPEGTTCVNSAGYRMLQLFVAIFMTVFVLAALVGGLSDLALEGWKMALYVTGTLLTHMALLELSLNLTSGRWYVHLAALIFGIIGVLMIGVAAMTN